MSKSIKNTFLVLGLMTTSLVLFSMEDSVNAETLVSNSLNQSSDEINTCLTKSLEEINSKNITDINNLVAEKLESADNCFQLIRGFLDGSQVELTFSNVLFTQEIRLSGKFTFSIVSLNDGVLTKDELKSFNLSVGLCSVNNLSQFSYIVGQKPSILLRLKYISVIIEGILDQDSKNNKIQSLKKSLESLTSDALWLIELRQQLFREITARGSFSSFPSATVKGFDSPLDLYLLSNMSPKLHIKCGSEKNQLSVDDGLAKGTFIQQNKSSSSDFGFNIETSETTLNGQTLIIRKKKQNNQIEITYQGLPIVISGSI